MIEFAFILGNGVTRLEVDCESLLDYGAVYGCNRIYQEFAPTVLVSTDTSMAEEIQKQLLINNQKDQKPDKIVQDYNDKIKIDTIKNPLVTPVENSKNIKVKNAVKNEVKKEVKNEVKNEDEEKRELDQELENELLELEESEDIIEVDTRDLKQNHL